MKPRVRHKIRTMTLRASLLGPKKPLHQFHDSDSLQWIKKHRPRALGSVAISSAMARLISDYAPWDKCKNVWFSNRSIREGIHGFRHCCRVAIYALVLSENRVWFSDQKLEALMFAGLLHDCRRANDNADPRHGKRGAAWLEKHPSVLPRHLRSMLPGICFAISVHNDPYSDIVGMSKYKQFKSFVDILKTADALDRYRFPRSDWWFSRRFVVLHPAVQEKSLAFDLVMQSESAHLAHQNSARSVVFAWKSCLEK